MQQQQRPAGQTERWGETATALPVSEVARLATLGPGFTRRQRAYLIFMRWLYLRGTLTDFPAGADRVPAGARFRSRW